jgi:hypothetical protein
MLYFCNRDEYSEPRHIWYNISITPTLGGTGIPLPGDGIHLIQVVCRSFLSDRSSLELNENGG